MMSGSEMSYSEDDYESDEELTADKSSENPKTFLSLDYMRKVIEYIYYILRRKAFLSLHFRINIKRFRIENIFQGSGRY